MAVQTDYLDNMPAGVPGAQATMRHADIVSRTVETAAIGFGRPVEQGVSDKGCKLFDGGTVTGITMLDRSATGATVVNGQVTGYTADSFGIGESARVMRKGDIWLTCATGCAAGDPVWVRPSNGAFQNSNANSAVQVVGRWETSAAAGALAVASINLP